MIRSARAKRVIRAARAERAIRAEKARKVQKVKKVTKAERGSWPPSSRLPRRAAGGLARGNRLERVQFLNTAPGVKSVTMAILETSACGHHVGIAQLKA